MRKMTAKQIAKANSARVDQACNAACIGLRIGVLDLSKISAHAWGLIAAGADDTALAAGARAVAEKLAID